MDTQSRECFLKDTYNSTGYDIWKVIKEKGRENISWEEEMLNSAEAFRSQYSVRHSLSEVHKKILYRIGEEWEEFQIKDKTANEQGKIEIKERSEYLWYLFFNVCMYGQYTFIEEVF